MTTGTFPRMPEVIPENRSGSYAVKHFTVSPQQSEMTLFRAMSCGEADVIVQPGTYAKLVQGDSVLMSDTQMERRSNIQVVYKARGRVLIGGLGLGMILKPILDKELVESVTVIEISREVIELVHPHLEHEKLKVVQGNVFDPPVNGKFDVIWMDIYPVISGSLVPYAEELEEIYRPMLSRWGWYGLWMEDEIRRRV